MDINYCLWCEYNYSDTKEVKIEERENGKLPELELREAANEGFELIGAFGWKHRGVGGIELWINQRGEKANQEIEKVDSEAVGDNVKPLQINNTQNVDGCNHESPNPSVEGMGSGFIQIVLKKLREFLQVLLHRCRRWTTATATATSTSLHSNHNKLTCDPNIRVLFWCKINGYY